MPQVFQVSRGEVTVVTECLVKRVDPPRFFPLVGEAELHRNHWKCTVYYTERMEASWPFPMQCKRPRVEVIYIDKDFLAPVR